MEDPGGYPKEMKRLAAGAPKDGAGAAKGKSSLALKSWLKLVPSGLLFTTM